MYAVFTEARRGLIAQNWSWGYQWAARSAGNQIQDSSAFNHRPPLYSSCRILKDSGINLRCGWFCTDYSAQGRRDLASLSTHGRSVLGSPCCSCAFSNIRFWHSCSKKIRKLYLFGLFLDHLSHPIGICLLWCWCHAVSVTMTPAEFEPRRCSNTALSTRGRLVCSVSIVLLSEFQDGFSNSVKDTLEFKGLQWTVGHSQW